MTTAEQYAPIRALDDAQLVVELYTVENEIATLGERLSALGDHLSKVADIIGERLGVAPDAMRRWLAERGDDDE